MKNVLVITSSFRSGSNSEALADAFIAGAKESGNNVEKIGLKGKQLGFCTGCLACQASKSGHCVQKDDADEIAQKMMEADVICFATLIYYYNVSGQLKVMLDRANPLYPVDYKFRDIYVLTSAAENEEDTPKRAIDNIQGWIDCFPKAKLAGTVFCGGVTAPGEASSNSAIESAKQMGGHISSGLGGVDMYG